MQENVSMQSKKLAYSVKELSKLVGVCERKIHYEIQAGNLKTVRIGRRVLIRVGEIDRWLSKAEGEALKNAA
jgi:excisionase family DNA binding protein